MANAISPRIVQLNAAFLGRNNAGFTPVDHIVGLRFRLADPFLMPDVATISNRPTIILNMLLSMGKAQTDCGPGGDESPPGG
ncbi:hypothetical protein LMG27174_06655 [Paraburkholderia rhynchosiae]|uniref:Uncharacterized protein n=1 Tax=Paraburkholderia rhynchosiae TaxID=487049 RepID=A0A6J5CL45_9BURK|nr:hypothetical protein LMG27174_06655 [Paraburkholderia rhynchosiae]